MTPDELQMVAWFGDLFLEGDIRCVFLWFHGLSGGCRTAPNQISAVEHEIARRGGLVVYPYTNPWSFLSRNELAFVERLITAVYRRYGLTDDIPLISAGQSMGGASALLYCRYGKWPVSRCVALSPLCDPEAYYASWTPSRPTGAAAMHNMFAVEPQSFEEALAEHSPLRQAAAMPDIPYMLLHGDGDDIVPKEHSDRMVAALRGAGRHVVYREMRHLGHVQLGVQDELAMADFVFGGYGLADKGA